MRQDKFKREIEPLSALKVYTGSHVPDFLIQLSCMKIVKIMDLKYLSLLIQF